MPSAMTPSGLKVWLTEEQVAMHDGFMRRGRMEDIPITAKDREQYERAKQVMYELEENPFITIYEGDIVLEPLQKRKWVPEETVEEWLERYRTAKVNGWVPEQFLPRPWSLGG